MIRCSERETSGPAAAMTRHRYAALDSAMGSSAAFAFLVILVLAVGACAGGGGGLPPIGVGGGEPSHIDATPSEVYSRIARGANRCWFGPRGSLSASHVFYAEVDPIAQGGKAEISVQERDVGEATPWGRKAFKIGLTPEGERTLIRVENVRLPAAAGEAMRADVFKWATGDTECSTAALATAPVGNVAAPERPALGPGSRASKR